MPASTRLKIVVSRVQVPVSPLPKGLQIGHFRDRATEAPDSFDRARWPVPAFFQAAAFEPSNAARKTIAGGHDPAARRATIPLTSRGASNASSRMSTAARTTASCARPGGPPYVGRRRHRGLARGRSGAMRMRRRSRSERASTTASSGLCAFDLTSRCGRGGETPLPRSARVLIERDTILPPGNQKLRHSSHLQLPPERRLAAKPTRRRWRCALIAASSIGWML
jgi:hypothetical protein